VAIPEGEEVTMSSDFVPKQQRVAAPVAYQVNGIGLIALQHWRPGQRW
jgi:hypothetical protein